MGEQTLVALVDSRPGVLDRIAGLLRRRSFTVRGLTLGRTEGPGRARLTVTVAGDEAEGRRLEALLGKLVEVLRAELVSHQPTVHRDLALIKLEPAPGALAQVAAVCAAFRARLVDVSPDSVIVEVTGSTSKIDRLRDLLAPFGIVEMVRSEGVALGRGRHRLVPAGAAALPHDAAATDPPEPARSQP